MMKILGGIPGDVLSDRPEEREVCTVRTLTGVALLLIGAATSALAAFDVPEIDPGSAAGALALLAGAILVMRGRRRS
jgi:hypothetical protein